MARKQWYDYPDTRTPLSAAAINDLEARKLDVGDWEINVKAPPYSAKGDGITDDTAAIQAAINAIPQTTNKTGGKVVFPPGRYLHTGLQWNDKDGVTLEGIGGEVSGTQYPELVYISNGTGNAFQMLSCHGTTFRGLRLSYNGVYTGVFIQGGQSGTLPLKDNSYFLMERCWVAGTQGATAASYLIDLKRCIIGQFRDCTFLRASRGISGMTPTDYSVNHQFQNCTFAQFTNAPVRNTGESWSFDHCTFEPLISGAPGGIDSDGLTTPFGLEITGCWFGDVSANNAGAWVRTRCKGVHISGNAIKIENAGSTNRAIQLDGCTGVAIVGNHFEGGQYHIEVITGTISTGVMIAGNDFTGYGTAALTGYGWLSNYTQLANNGMFSSIAAQTDFGGLVTHQDNVQISVAGKGLIVAGGAGARVGTSTLVAGTVTVTNATVTANTRVLVSRATSGGTVGHLSVSRVAGTSFTVTSSSAADTSVVDWMLVEQA